jgi:hypothetical protein
MESLSRIGSGKIHGYETETMPDWEDAYNEWKKAREYKRLLYMNIAVLMTHSDHSSK